MKLLILLAIFFAGCSRTEYYKVRTTEASVEGQKIYEIKQVQKL